MLYYEQMAFRNRVEKLKNRSRFCNSNGQAAIEYILILTVSVTLVLSLMYQLFQPMQTFLKAYMGDYVACLLESGELPSLGDSDAKSALADQGCNAQFQGATFKNGRPPVNTSMNRPDSGSGSSSKSSRSDSDKEKDKSGSSSSSNPPSNVGGFKSRSKGVESSNAGAEKIVEVPGEVSQSSFYNRQGSWGSSSEGLSGRKTAVGVAGMTEDEKKKMERKENASRVIASGEEFGAKPKKVSIKKPEPKIEIPPEEGFTFGSFLRFLLIAGIVIAILVVLGSQALKISKSQE